MPYVQRTDGFVSGVFANAQPGYAEEFLEDDNAEVVSYLANPTAPRTFDAQLAALDAEFERKKAALALRLQTIELADGPTAAANKSAIQAEYTTLATEHEDAVNELLFG